MHSQLRRCMQSVSKRMIHAQQRSMSFKVRVGAIEAPKTPIAELQRVQQMWSISGNETLEKLRVATPGLTYVSVAPPAFFNEVAEAQGISNDQLVAVARVSSDAQDPLTRVDVLTRSSNRLMIGFDPRPPLGWPIEKTSEPGKHLLTELFVREASELRNIGAFGGGSLVVTDSSEHGSVLVNDRPFGKVKLAALRGSRVFVMQEQGLQVGSMSLLSAQGGQLFLSTPELFVKDRIRAAASGRWGEAKIMVQTSKLWTPSLGAAVVGSGGVRFAASSSDDDCRCDQQSLAMADSGRIDTGDLASRNARVAILGSGSATLQTSDSLFVGTLGNARVNYLESEPVSVYGSSSSLRALTAAAKLQRNEERASMITPPTRESAFEGVGYNVNRWWWAPWAPWAACRSRGFRHRHWQQSKRWRDDFTS